MNPTSLPSKNEVAQLLEKYNRSQPIDKTGAPAAALGWRAFRLDGHYSRDRPQWLKNNVRNRALRWEVVVAYARDMKSGNWVSHASGTCL